MSADLEQDLREMLQRTAGEVQWTPVPTRGLVRRARLRRVTVASVAMVVLLAAAGTVPLAQRWIDTTRVDFAPANPGRDDVTPEANPQSLPWPQATIEEARKAQERADAGDPEYTWQLDPALLNGERPTDAAIFSRFLTEELGWDGFRCCAERAHGESMHWPAVDEADFVRCAADATNPLYPDDPRGRSCAPTLDDGGYERVRVTAGQPLESTPNGIWTIQRSVPQSPFHQTTPPSDAEIADEVEPFLQARVNGTGAERHVDSDPAEIPLLYAASDGARYERFEHEVLEGPLWPYGSVVVNARLFANGGQTVVEQAFRLEAGFLEYRPISPTTEDGAPVPDAYNILGGQVRFAAGQSWEPGVYGPGFFYRSAPNIAGFTREEDRAQLFIVLSDPLAPTGSCAVGDPARSADALVSSIRTRSNLSVSEPQPARIGSIDAVQLDITAAEGEGCMVSAYRSRGSARQEAAVLSAADDNGRPELWWSVGRHDRARLYAFDIPGSRARTAAILITAPETDFQAVAEAAQPILDSFALSGD